MSTSQREEFLKKARARKKIADMAYQNIIKAAKHDLAMLYGNQWDDDSGSLGIYNNRVSSSVPTLTINKERKFVEQVIGEILQNKISIELSPADGKGNKITSQIKAERIRQIEYESDAEGVYDYASRQTCESGFSYVRVITEYEEGDSFAQRLRIRNIPCQFSVRLDPRARRGTGIKPKFAFVTEVLSKDEFKARFPKADDMLSQSFGSDDNGTERMGWFEKEKVRIAGYYFIEEEEKEIALLDDGTVIDVNDGIPKDKKEVRRRKTTHNKVKHCIITDTEILSDIEELPGNVIPIIEFAGPEMDVQGERVLRSVCRYQHDAQKLFNYQRSAYATGLMSASKSQVMGTAEMFQGYESDWDNMNTSYSARLLYHPDERGGKPERVPPPNIPDGLLMDMKMADEDMKDTAAMWNLGAPGNERSGDAIRARKHPQDITIFAFIDCCNKGVEAVGRLLVDMLPEIESGPQDVRVRKADGTERLIPINQPVVPSEKNNKGEVVNYKKEADYLNPSEFPALQAQKIDFNQKDTVRVKVGPAFSTQRAEAVSRMSELIRGAGAQSGAYLPILFEYEDFEGAEQLAAVGRKLYPNLYPPREGDDATPAPPNPKVQIEQMKMHTRMMGEQTKRMGLEVKAQAHQVSMAKIQKEMAALGMDSNENIQEQVLQVIQGLAAHGIISLNQPQEAM